ncbi:Leucine Rich repeats (2 copies) [compost metagenome]
MKQLIILILILASKNTFSQCSVCFSLEEAKIAPYEVEELHLSNSSITVIDSSFNRFTLLKVLDLSYNPVTEISETASIPSLKELNVSNGSYNPWKIGAIGKAFPKLEQLDLSNNQLSFIWSGLQSLGNLVHLNVSDNQLIDIPVEVMYLSNLKELNISKNEIKLQANELGALWSLEKLDISGNSGLSTDNLVLSISENKRLKNLVIDGNELSSKSIQLLSQMNLERLELTEVQKPSGIDFTRFPTVKKIAFTRSPDWFSNETIKQFDNVTELELSNSPVPATLQKMKSLNTLILNNVAKTEIPNLFSLKNLRVLDVSNTSLDVNQISQLKLELPTTHIITGMDDVTKKMISNSMQPLIEIPAKEFLLQSDKPGSIAEKNVRFEVPPNAFLDPKGNPYSGKVKVALTVYDDPIQLALAGIPMSFTENNQEEIFASNGMFRFEAKGENNEILQPDPTNLIQVSLGDLQPNNKGRLYVFNPQTAQWNTISDTVSSQNTAARIQWITDSINKLDLKNLVPRSINDRLFSISPVFSRLDRTEIRLRSQFFSMPRSNSMVVQNRNNHLGKAMTKQRWAVDTLVSPEMKKQFKLMKKETKPWSNRNLEKRGYGMFIPRLINNLMIVPDPAHDNYRLIFKYRDSTINLPVALTGTSNKQIQQNTQRFESDFKTTRSKDLKEKKSYEKSVEEQLKIAESQLRQSLISRAIAQITNPGLNSNFQNNPNRLNFGLTRFGLINCDFFMRERGEYFVETGSQLIDQNGEKYKTPSSVITVDPVRNFYLEAAAQFPINCFRTSYIIFDLGDKKLGVTKPGRNETIKHITLIDIRDKTPEEVSKAILSI